jgi:hypothetical protein
MLPLNKVQVLKDEAVSGISGNRRSKQRFPIDFPVQYKIMRNYLIIGTGTGTTVDISSGGIAFMANESLKIGAYVELSVAWPVLLNGSCPLKLVVEGRVVRSNGSLTAIRMDRHEFRTQRRSVAATQPAVAMAAGL